jgi:hypothetical protein
MDENHRPADISRQKDLHSEKTKMRNLHPQQDMSLSIHLQLKQPETPAKHPSKKT